jgi:hypothetical protein
MASDDNSPAPRIILRRSGKAKEHRRVLLPNRDQLTAAITAIPPGTTLPLPALKAGLAAAHGTDLCCPITTRKVLDGLAADMVSGAPLPLWRLLPPDDVTIRRHQAGPLVTARRAEEAAP